MQIRQIVPNVETWT